MKDIFDDWYDVHIEEDEMAVEKEKDHRIVWHDMSTLTHTIDKLAKARKIQRAWRRYKTNSLPHEPVCLLIKKRRIW
jgi:hypothetical protein